MLLISKFATKLFMTLNLHFQRHRRITQLKQTNADSYSPLNPKGQFDRRLQMC